MTGSTAQVGDSEGVASNKGKHVVFLQGAGVGHINPTAPLIAAMMANGIKVTYFASSAETFPIDPVSDGTPLGELVKSAGAILRNYRIDPSLDDEPLLASGGNPRHPGKVFSCLPPLLDDLKALQPPADVIVYDCFLVLPQIAGCILDIPAVGLIPNTGPACSAPYENEVFLELYKGPCKFVRDKYGIDVLDFGVPVSSWYSSLLNIVMTCEELYMGFANEAQKQKFGSARFQCVGSMINLQTSKRPPIAEFAMDSITSARDAGKKVVLMSLGSTVTGMFWSAKMPSGRNDDGTKIDDKLLSEMSGQEFARFVWKVAFEALGESEEITVVMALGKREDVLEGLNVPKNFFPFAVLPQLEVLPLCSAFITHGGMGSVMESIVYHVPMIVVPAFGDQPDNADSVQRSNMGFGFRYPLKTLSKESLSKAVAELLDPDPTTKYREAVKSTAERMEATGGAAKAIELILSVAK
eukprot:TRINITY_DN37376_c0_g1_i1.p1 TRINITY_DN37376_c0_g1~~TRINITY_DN37376_c0_g1_i1.p1  ORF type:complete len:468 (-),score=82.52 TRINITY_DN37376_c0_g1_i1:231-1634(-)